MSMSSSSSSSGSKPRTIILCFDGTSNQYDGSNTNVVKFYSLLKKDNTDEQLCYYQPGIGTYFNPGVVAPLFQWCAKILDEAVAWYLDEHVQGGYTFLMQNYRPGDKICIFGFSRGAYTARALAGFLHKIGLLPKDNPEQVPLAYKLYKRTDTGSDDLAAGFKQTFCRTVTIEFMGVWDTVASVGVIMARTLPFTTTNTTIKVFRHALSLDERRTKFQPSLYHRLSPDATRTVQDAEAIAELERVRAEELPNSPISVLSDESHSNSNLKGKEKVKVEVKAGTPPTKPVPLGKGDKWLPFPRKRLFGKLGRKKDVAIGAHGRGLKARHLKLLTDTGVPDDFVGFTDVFEVWFSGCHGDVGGGSVPNTTVHALADIPLRWMVRQVVQSQCGIQFDQAALLRANIPESIFTDADTEIDATRPTRDGKVQPTLHFFMESNGNGAERSRRSEESQASATSDASTQLDAVQPLDDELKKNLWWWLLEIIPTSYTYQDGDGNWHVKWSIHLGRGRNIPDIKPNFHESVKDRMDDAALKYKPRATWKTGTEVFVS